MKIDKKIFTFFVVIVSCVLISGALEAAREETEEEETTSEGEYEYEEGRVDTSLRDYMRLYYAFGLGGAYWARRAGTDLKGMIGAYGGFEYRFSRLLSAGFDSNYGWLFGNGNQYLSTFNPGIKIFPFMYKNPAYEPFIFLGGKAFDAVFGTNNYDRLAYGQGGFAGIGMRMFPGQGLMGFQFFIRAEFMYMTRPTPVGGKGLAIPIYGMVGVVY